jgi:hypothetical protein
MYYGLYKLVTHSEGHQIPGARRVLEHSLEISRCYGYGTSAITL